MLSVSLNKMQRYKDKTMVNKKWLVILALVFGVMAAGCSDSSKDDDVNFLDNYTFSTENPGDADLTAAGLSQSQFNQIKETAGGGFKGWELDNGNKLFTMAWSGRSLSDINNLAGVLETMLGKGDIGSNDKEGYYYIDCENKYKLEYFSKKLSKNGFFVLSGTLLFSKFL